MSEISFSSADADAPGYLAHAAISVERSIASLTKTAVSSLSLGRPATNTQGVILTGADNAVGRRSYLLCVDGDVLMKPARGNSVLCYVQQDEPINDAQWLTPTTAVCAAGRGKLMVFNVSNGERPAIRQLSSISHIHSDHIREVAVKPGEEGVIASGGFDGCLCITELANGGQESSKPLIFPTRIISSVKWPLFNTSMCVSCTSEDGEYALVDTRGGPTQPAVRSNLGKKDLFTHCLLNDHTVLLGYGDAEMKQIDLRQPALSASSVVDPYVEGIGNMEYNAASSLLIVSGYTDCSVWKISDGRGRLWSHMVHGANLLTNNNAFSTNGGFWDQNTTTVADSHGNLHMYLQSN